MKQTQSSTEYSPGQTTKYLGDVGVVSPRFGDGDAQFRVAEGAQSGDAAPQDPNHQGQTHWAGVLQDPLWRDEDPRAYDVAWGGKRRS